jgi:CheY-like chemotaxis protein
VFSGKSVLIADDQPVGREFLRTILESSGIAVTEASDGEEALAAARATVFDLILLDIQMPVLDGLGVVSELRTDPRYASAPIIAVTATAMKGDRQRGIDAGFTEYLTKPFSLTDLRRLIAQYLQTV